MSNSKIVKILGVVGIVIALVAVFTAGKVDEPVGGTYNSVMVDFGEGISVDGTTVINGSGALVPTADMVLGGTTPSLTIGDAGEEDAQVIFDGNAQDFSIGLDDSVDDLVISLGTALGTTNLLAFTDTGVATHTGSTDGDLTIYGAGTSASDAYLRLVGDAGADTSDRWQLWNDSSAGTLYFQSDPSVAGTYATAASLTSAGALTATTSISSTTTLTGGTGITATTGAITATAGDLVLTDGRVDMAIEASPVNCAANAVTLDLNTTQMGVVSADQVSGACAITFSNGSAGEFVVLDLVYGGDTAWTLAAGGHFGGDTWDEADCANFQATAVDGDHLILTGVMQDANTIIPVSCYYADQS